MDAILSCRMGSKRIARVNTDDVNGR
jgi:hypothetical protein